MMVTGAIFNVYTLRGGAFRNPETFLDDARWVEGKRARILLDIHDKTLRLIAQGKDGREAAEALYMPRHLREGREAYGQVESHVRQVHGGTIGWFGGDVYEINPLSLREEARRTITAMGGQAAVRKAAAEAARTGGLANWRWNLRLTSLLLQLDPSDVEARRVRADAARALGQRTTSANARGFYITEALQLEGQLKVDGQPMTLDENLQFLRYLVNPRQAEGQRLLFTIALAGEPAIRSVELRNGVLVIAPAEARATRHVTLSRRELAAFVRGQNVPARGGTALA